MEKLFEAQIGHLDEAHFLILLWTAMAEDKMKAYNITNCFDDLKHHRITRTKQTAVSSVDSLFALCFIDIRGEGNRKNLYITKHGAKALETLVLKANFKPKPSIFLEGS